MVCAPKSRNPETCPYVYRTDCNLPQDALVELYTTVGWTAYTALERRADLARAIENSSYVITAWHDELLVGLARCLSDDVAIVYIQDVLVRPQYQRQGLGTHLIEACLARYQHVRMCVLLTDTDPGTARFYERLGFSSTCQPTTGSLDAFVRLRDPNPR